MQRSMHSPAHVDSPENLAGGSLDGCLHEGPILRFSQVKVCFDERTALSDISLEVNAGETIVLCGATGSGKTVLLKTAIGLIRPDAGDAYLLSQNISHLDEHELFPLRHCVGVLFQEGGLFDSLTVGENVAYPLLNRWDRKLPESEVQARVQEALELVNLKTSAEKFPSELSGGMRRRVGIARAVVTNPTLILYDSPTGGLDPITAYRIMSLVIRQRDTQNTTSVVVTHRWQDGYLLANYVYDPIAGKPTRALEVRRPTRFVVLREGRIVFQGSEAEMHSSTDAYVARFAGRKISSGPQSAGPDYALVVRGSNKLPETVPR
jgi:phospholipid/cholesterol/gamma-HCH transport system ATP-binding protein